MLPFLLRVPRHTTPDECLCPSQSALGFGDIVLPALLVAFAMRFDCFLLFVRAASDIDGDVGSDGYSALPTRGGVGRSARPSGFLQRNQCVEAGV